MLASIRLYVLQNLFRRYRQEMKYSISLRSYLKKFITEKDDKFYEKGSMKL